MALFEEGKQFPPAESLPRLAKYQRMEKIYKGEDLLKIYKRAEIILNNSEHSKDLQKLYLGVQLAEILTKKPADLLVGEEPIFDAGDDGGRQEAIQRIKDNNSIHTLLHEMATSGGYRGDSFFKVLYNYRQDFSELLSFGGKIPASAKPEAIIEAVNPSYVFPEVSDKNVKSFKAVNIAYVQWEESKYGLGDEKPYLYVERHIPNFIFYHKFRLYEKGLYTGGYGDITESKGVFGEKDKYYAEEKGCEIQLFTIGELVEKEGKTIEETGVPFPLVFHFPYSAIDTDWEGRGFVESVEGLLSALNDRMAHISYILWKHADPTAYGPDLNGYGGDNISWGGKYIPLDKDDATPGYMTWEAQLSSAFMELDNIIGLIFMLAETPQFLFGTTLTNDKAGSGTSHTDGSAIKARFLPITSKVNRIRLHLDKAIKQAFYAAQLLENNANKKTKDFTSYEAKIPKITWRDGIPRDDKEEAETLAILTGNKPLMDSVTGIKRFHDLSDKEAEEMYARIQEMVKSERPATPDIFNEIPTPEPEEEPTDE
jgi:hypothetical protein